MVWWYVIPAIASAAASIGGGILSSSAASAEAARAQAYADYNADAALAWGAEQSRMISMAALVNTTLLQNQTEYNAQLRDMDIAYNTDVLRSVQAYNEALYSQEIDQVMDQLELDSEMLHVDYTKAVGSAVAQQGASGTIIDEGSNAEAVINLRTEEALMDLIIDTNAMNKVSALKNAIAQGDYETEMQIQKLQWEGEVANLSEAYAANAQSKAAVFDSFMQVATTRRTAETRAQSLLMGGEQTASAQNTQATSYMFTGITSAGTSLLDAYGSYKIAGN